MTKFRNVLLFHKLISFHCFALLWLRILSSHGWPFTEVLRKIRRDVTRKMQKSCEPRITRMSGIGERRLPVWLFRLRKPKMLHDALTHGSLKLAGPFFAKTCSSLSESQ